MSRKKSFRYKCLRANGQTKQRLEFRVIFCLWTSQNRMF